jgi:hypothetical protein
MTLFEHYMLATVFAYALIDAVCVSVQLFLDWEN